MPATNEEFIKKAFEAGLSEDQVRSAVAERNQKKSKITPSATPKNEPNILQSVARMFGVDTNAKNIKAAVTAPFIGKQADNLRDVTDQSFKNSQELIYKAKRESDPATKKMLLDASRSVDEGNSGLVDELSSQINDLQKQAGITETDLKGSNLGFAVKRGIGGAAELAAMGLPSLDVVKKGLAAAKTAGAVPRIIGAASTGLTQGGLGGLADASVASEDPLDAVKKILTAGATGAATSGALQTGAEGINAVKSGKNKITDAAKNLYGSTLKENIKDQKFYKQAGGKDLVIEDAIRLNLPPTKEGVRNELLNFGEEFNNKVDDALLKSQKFGQKADLAKLYSEAKQKTIDDLQGPENRNLLKQAQDYFDAADKIYLAPESKSVDFAQINELRKKLDSRVGEILQQDISNGEGKAYKNFASILRENFKTNFPELKDDFRKYHLLSGLAEAMQKEPSFGLTDLVGATLFSPGGIPGAAAGYVGTKAVRSPGLKRTLSGKVISNLSQLDQSDATTMTPELLRSVATILGSRQAITE